MKKLDTKWLMAFIDEKTIKKISVQYQIPLKIHVSVHITVPFRQHTVLQDDQFAAQKKREYY